jgi:DNA-binding HxlR family transcriptional regulator
VRPVARRTYNQICPLASALDLVGERWTLLVVRELIAGPKRYSDLQAGLPGLATDLLTARLRDLEAAGLVTRRRLTPPAAANVYELTGRGRELEPVLLALGRFGMDLMPELEEGDVVPLERVGLLLRLLFDPRASRGRHDRYRLDVEGVGRVTADVDDGTLSMDDGPGDVTISASPATMIAVARGQLSPAQALAAGKVHADDPERLARFLATFPPRVTMAA